MNWFPADLPSFVWGVVVGLVGAVFTGFLREAGKDGYLWLKEKILRSPPDPVKVDGRFVPELYEPGLCAWVGEEKVYDYERKGWTYYPHPRDDAKCYREVWTGNRKSLEYLMVQPEAQRKPEPA